ncbi:MAG: exodeoxyribonuclease III [Lactobacillaceae bacterium]|jgi:exodeoxyribonuclease-3|nr:exodeoxyribonuclease III [Lactobacillaceae bacterium]
MKFISWNIDSLNAALEQKSDRAKMTFSVLEEIARLEPDVLSIQETKLKSSGLSAKQEDIVAELFPNYFGYFNYSVPPARSGYSGTMMLSKTEPIGVDKPVIGAPSTMDSEGRIITLEFDNFFVSEVYTPNSGSELKRLEERIEWDSKYREYVSSLDAKKPVIFSGDFNVAHKEIDLKNDKTNHHSAGFTDEERNSFSSLLDAGFTDIWRKMNPETEAYTWWAQIARDSKRNNAGWRIDYYLVSDRIADNVSDAGMIDTGERKDHGPIFIDVEI